VEQKNGQKIFKLANLKKSIYSLNDLRLLLVAANKRYLAFISEIDDPSAGRKLLHQVVVSLSNGTQRAPWTNLQRIQLLLHE